MGERDPPHLRSTLAKPIERGVRQTSHLRVEPIGEILLRHAHHQPVDAPVHRVREVRHGLHRRRRVTLVVPGDRRQQHSRLTGGPAERADLVERLELSGDTLKRPVRDYSRGMRQKLGIVQALQHDPELAILDEPSEGLDPLMQRAFYDILDDLRADGRTIFFSSHVLSEVERVCDRVAIIRRGHLVALEEVESLLARRQRNVELRVDGPLPDLAAVRSVSALATSEGFASFRLAGDVAPFLAAIRDTTVRDLTIEPARLEEAFLEFYEDE